MICAAPVAEPRCIGLRAGRQPSIRGNADLHHREKFVICVVTNRGMRLDVSARPETVFLTQRHRPLMAFDRQRGAGESLRNVSAEIMNVLAGGW